MMRGSGGSGRSSGSGGVIGYGIVIEVHSSIDTWLIACDNCMRDAGMIMAAVAAKEMHSCI